MVSQNACLCLSYELLNELKSVFGIALLLSGYTEATDFMKNFGGLGAKGGIEGLMRLVRSFGWKPC